MAPEATKKNQALPEPGITPTTKPTQGGHDAPTTEAAILGTQLVTTDQWHEMAQKNLALCARGQQIAAKKGLILVHTYTSMPTSSSSTSPFPSPLTE